MPKASATNAAGVVMADVDTNVPGPAAKHYAAALKALEAKDATKAITELQEAIKIYPQYYAAHVELGRQFRSLKRFTEAEQVLWIASELGPHHADAHLEYGLALLALEKHNESVREFRKAIELDEKGW